MIDAVDSIMEKHKKAFDVLGEAYVESSEE